MIFVEPDYKSEQKENAKSGVYWLLKASEQGNLEATDLLRTCLKTGKGISEHNYIDVKSCISMPQDEKIVRRAAKEVFARFVSHFTVIEMMFELFHFSLSNGSEYITSNQLQRKILAIDRGEFCPSKLTENGDLQQPGDYTNGDLTNNLENSSESEEEDDIDWSEVSDTSNEKLTEESLISAAVSFSNGHLPVVNNVLCLTQPNLKSLDNIPFIYWSILHPILTLKVLYFKLIKYLGCQSLPLPLVRPDVQLLMLILIYNVVSFKNLVYFIPTVIFYISFIVMVVTTFQLLQTQRELHDFCLWRGLFICYSKGDLNEYSFETEFILNHTKQYAWFFFGLVVHYFMYSITPVKLESEFTVISCCLMFMTLFGFMPKRRSKTVIDSLVLLSFAVNVLARYPYDTDPIVSKGWRYLELNFPSFPSYVVGNGIEFCISFRLVLYALIPVVMVYMAMKEKWRGTYKTLLPHLVTLSWLQYFALCSHNATTYGLLRATLALVGSVLFLPLVGLTSVIIPVVAVTQWIVTSNIIYTVALFLFLLSICLAVCFMCARTKYAQYTAAVQVILMLVAFLALIKTHGRSSNLSASRDFALDVEPKALEWESFQKLCYQKGWEGRENGAQAQVRCSELENTHVFWEGTVSSVNLASISNRIKFYLDQLPSWARDYLYCVLGDRQEQCNQDDPSEISDCLILRQSTNGCTLKRFNTYSFEVGLEMRSLLWRLNPEVVLLLSDEFKNFTWALKKEDLIWFKGTLINSKEHGTKGMLGSFSVYVHVEEIGCISCQNRDLSPVKLKNGAFNVRWLKMISGGFKFLLNVMFNPVLIFN